MGCLKNIIHLIILANLITNVDQLYTTDRKEQLYITGLHLWSNWPRLLWGTNYVRHSQTMYETTIVLLTRRVPLVEQKLFTLLGAPDFTSCFLWGSCYSIFSFSCMFCRSLFILLCLFYLVTVSVLQFTDSDYPSGIFKHYNQRQKWKVW